jgi:hypothetical protein
MECNFDTRTISVSVSGFSKVNENDLDPTNGPRRHLHFCTYTVHKVCNRIPYRYTDDTEKTKNESFSKLS